MYKNTFYIQPEGENQVALSYNQRHAKEPRTVVYRLILGREARYAAEKHSDNDTGSGQSVVKGKRAISGWRPWNLTQCRCPTEYDLRVESARESLRLSGRILWTLQPRLTNRFRRFPGLMSMTSPNCEDQSGPTKSSSWGEYVCPDVSASGENDRGKVSLQFCSSRTGYSGETDWEGCVFNSFDRSDHSAKVRFGECRVPNHAATFVLSEYRTIRCLG